MPTSPTKQPITKPRPIAKSRRSPVSRELKRDSILLAARRVFETEGLEGASLRAIAKQAGYTPAALYFHFDSKEVVYAELLSQSLGRLKAEIESAIQQADNPALQFKASAMAFFNYYRNNPGDLDLGFYLFRGGMKPKGLGRARDIELNQQLQSGLQPMADAALAMNASAARASEITASVFAYATGLLLLAHTGRIRIFNASAEQMMASFSDTLASRICGETAC
ncbi:TetR/AcrR family transcriptional regulator [Porticoccus sp.]|uniref:TetR/AcrR family transcriptional regulator n=1 Tax=Porticoccus sp. TaxID=2024853 RepID=UPI003F6A4A7D